MELGWLFGGDLESEEKGYDKKLTRGQLRVLCFRCAGWAILGDDLRGDAFLEPSYLYLLMVTEKGVPGDGSGTVEIQAVAVCLPPRAFDDGGTESYWVPSLAGPFESFAQFWACTHLPLHAPPLPPPLLPPSLSPR